jgi:hypothetical protein
VGKQLRLQRVPGSPNLVAAAATGMVTCGAIAPDTSTLVTLVVHAMPPRTFDVLLDGAATACTGLATGLEPPFVGFEIMDPSNEGYGGRVTFDGLSL